MLLPMLDPEFCYPFFVVASSSLPVGIILLPVFGAFMFLDCQEQEGSRNEGVEAEA